jgi:hypothetical protein
VRVGEAVETAGMTLEDRESLVTAVRDRIKEMLA